MEDLDYFKFLLVLFLVIGLIGLFGFLLRRIGFGGVRVTAGRGRRLGIQEVLPVDARRRLVLVRRDDREHLILLGAAQDIVIETDIAAPAAAEGETDKPARTAGNGSPFKRLIEAARNKGQ